MFQALADNLKPPAKVSVPVRPKALHAREIVPGHHEMIAAALTQQTVGLGWGR